MNAMELEFVRCAKEQAELILIHILLLRIQLQMVQVHQDVIYATEQENVPIAMVEVKNKSFLDELII